MAAFLARRLNARATPPLLHLLNRTRAAAEEIVALVLGFNQLDDLASLPPENGNRKHVTLEVAAIISKHFAAVPVGQEERNQMNLVHELAVYLDALTITSDNIGDIRRSCFVPWGSRWNGIVREQTAERERSSDPTAAPSPAPETAPVQSERPASDRVVAEIKERIPVYAAAEGELAAVMCADIYFLLNERSALLKEYGNG